MPNKRPAAVAALLLCSSLGQARAEEPTPPPQPRDVAEAAQPQPVPQPVPQPASMPADAAARVLPLVELKATPLREAIERLAEQAGVNVFVSWNVLARAGVHAGTPVDVRLANVPLGKVLDLVLADAGAGEGVVGWAVEEGLIRVSTRADLERAAHVRQERRDWVDEARVQEQLDRRIPSVRFDRTPLWQAIEAVAGRAGFKTFVHWRVLEKDAEVRQSEPITLDLSNPTADEALRAVLDGAGRSRVPLAYVVRQGAVEITTRDALRYFTVVRVYDLRDLLQPAPAAGPAGAGGDARPAAAAPGPGARGQDARGQDARGQDALVHDARRPEARGPDTRGAAAAAGPSTMADFRRVIQDTVDPDSWRDNGGAVGAIDSPGGPFAGLLVVVQTRDNHEKLRRLLDTLRSYRAERPGNAGPPAVTPAKVPGGQGVEGAGR